ncbi:MAG: hypothetical protein ACF788_08610 [Novipirellula sp. JB048]
MVRYILACVSFVAFTPIGVADDSNLASKFGKEVRVPSNLGFSTNISDDGQTLTLIFDNLLVDLRATQQGARATHNQTAIETKVFTVNIPYSTSAKDMQMAMDVRGFLSSDPGATVRLVACAGGATKVVDLCTDKSKGTKLKGDRKKSLMAEYPEYQFGDFQDRVEFTLQPHAKKPVCQVTLLLVVERDTDTAGDGGALMVVDSLDLSFAEPNERH